MRRLLLTTLVSFIALLSYSQEKLNLSVKDSYNRLWEAKTAYDHDDLPRSCIDVCKLIVKKADEEENFPELVNGMLSLGSYRMDISPDSIMEDLSEYENLLTRPVTTSGSDSTIKQSILHALLGSVYNAVYTSSLTRSDQTLRSECKSKVLSHTISALSCKSSLANKDASPYKSLYKEGSDSKLFNNDVLSLLLNFSERTLFKAPYYSYPSESLLPHLEEAKSLYSSLGLRDASTLTQLHIFSLQSNFASKEKRLDSSAYRDSLESLYKRSLDIASGADVYYAWYKSLRGLHATDRLRHLRFGKSQWPDSEYAKVFSSLETSLFDKEGSLYVYNIETAYKDFNVSVTHKNVRSLLLTVTESHKKTVYRREFISEGYIESPDYAEDIQTDTVHLNLPPGTYRINLSSDGKELSTKRFSLSSTKLTSYTLEGRGTMLTVVDALHGQPISNCKVIAYYHKYNNHKEDSISGTFYTDRNGQVLFTDGNYSYAYALRNSDDRSSDCRLSHITNYINSTKATSHTEIYTDRAIYRPGQTVHVSCISYTQEGDIVRVDSGKTHTISLIDANHQEVVSQTIESDSYGMSSAEFEIPKGRLNGTYHLRSGNDSQSIEVEEYKRPTFDIEFLPHEGSIAFGDTIRVIGRAMTYYGVPVQDAKVKYDIEYNTLSDWWYYRSPSNWAAVKNGELTTDSDGKFYIDLYLDGDRSVDSDLESWCRTFSGLILYKVHAQVTDLGGESHEGSTTLRVSSYDYSLSLKVPENIDTGNLPELKVEAVNSQSQPVVATGKWELLTYDPDNDKEGYSPIQNGTFTSNEPLSIPGLSVLPLGEYKLQIESADTKGHNLKQSTVFYLYSLKGGSMNISRDWIYTPSHTFGDEGIDIYYALVKRSPKQPYSYIYIQSHNDVEYEEICPHSNSIQHIHLETSDKYLNGLGFMLNYTYDNDSKTLDEHFTYVRPSKTLKLEWSTFRDKLHPGEEETWTLVVKDKDGRPAIAQVLAGMYDSSLDFFTPHSWPLSLYFYRTYPSYGVNVGNSYYYLGSQKLNFPSTRIESFSRTYNQLQGFSRNMYNSYMSNRLMSRGADRKVDYSSDVRPMVEAEPGIKEVVMLKATMDEADAGMIEEEEPSVDSSVEQPDAIEIRSDFSETAFFYPGLECDNQGEVRIHFTLPESLTEWKVLALAHTQDMDYGHLISKVVARKEFMIQPNIPRFVRSGDHLSISTRVINQSSDSQEGTVSLKLIDPSTEELVYISEKPFKVAPEGTGSVDFSYDAIDAYPMLICEIIGNSGSFSDGERHWLPVLTSKRHLTETVPFYLIDSGTKEVDISSLFNGNSPSSDHREMTIEYSDNPSWNVILSLHTAISPIRDSAIDWASSLYVNCLVKHLSSRLPHLEELISQWQSEPAGDGTLDSELTKNQELKDILLEEAPWMLDALDETEDRQKLCELFDMNLLDRRIELAKEKLQSLQCSDGGWSWFKGMESSYYTTLSVCSHLSKLSSYLTRNSSSIDKSVTKMLNKGMDFLDHEELEYYQKCGKQDKRWLPSNSTLHYIYMTLDCGRKGTGKQKTMFDDYVKRIKKHPKDLSIYGKSNCALVLSAYGETSSSKKFIESLREYTVYKSGMGRYFDTEKSLYSWCDYRIPGHIAAMRAMHLLGSSISDNNVYLTEMQLWLLRQKEGQKWNNVLTTIDASDLLLSLNPSTTFHEESLPKISVGSTPLAIHSQTSGIGYLKERVDSSSVKSVMEMSEPKVLVEKSSQGVSWGAVYGQCIDDLDKIESSGESLTITRRFYIESSSSGHPEWIEVGTEHLFKVGDKLKIRLEVRSDRDLDFVQVRNQHASCLEPQRSNSGYQWLGGRGGYLSLHDSCSDIFFSKFIKGTATIDLDYYVTSAGEYTNGIATVQCAYAPSYIGHSDGVRIKVER